MNVLRRGSVPGRAARAAETGQPSGRRGSAAPSAVAASNVAGNGTGLGWRESIKATVTGLGFELVDIERAPRGLLRVSIDRVPGRSYPTDRKGLTLAPLDSEPVQAAMAATSDADLRDGEIALPRESVTVDDCEQVTRQLQYVLEVEAFEYARLEVSSPGLDRPLRTEADFVRFAGQAVSVTLKVPFQGRKNWEGVLKAAPEGGGWELHFTDGKVEQVLGFALDELRGANLVPVLDFKGRRSRAPALAEGQAGAAPGPTAVPGEAGG